MESLIPPSHATVPQLARAVCVTRRAANTETIAWFLPEKI